MQGRLTKRTIETAMPRDKDWTLWDSDISGFGCKFTRAGRRVYVVKYRFGGRQRWYTIGRHGAPWTADGARKEALRLLGRVADGEDPAEAKAADRAAITVRELCTLYLEEGAATKKASTLATDRGRINRHIVPLLGRKRVCDVTRADIERFMRDVAAGKTKADEKTGPHGRAIVRGGKGAATRTVGLLGGIFSFAVRHGLRADSPVAGVKRYRDRKNERFLSSDEISALGRALAAAERDGVNPFAIAGLRLLMLTGARKSEIVTLQWRHVDFERSCLRLPDSKTGEKVIPLGAPALDVLANLPRVEGNPYVLPGDMEGQHYVGLPKVWREVRDRAELGDVRLHDLRHTFASVGAAHGQSLVLIGALLGHRDSKTTSRYAHLTDDPVKRAADTMSGEIAALMAGGSKKDDSGQVVTLPKRA